MQELAVVFIDKTFDRLYTVSDRLPETTEEPEDCINNFMCSCERQDCPGRTVPTKSYMKRLKRNIKKESK